MAELTLPEPVLVEAVADWFVTFNPTKEWMTRLGEWLTAHEVSPRHCWKFEVFVIDGLFMRVYQYEPDLWGSPHCGREHSHTNWGNGPDDCATAQREPYIVPLTSMPPERP